MAERDDPPLKGYRVLELGSTAAGPFCARLLADFGAEVIKVEAAEGDPIRQLAATYKGKSLYAASILRNKSNISINLRDPRGQDIIRRFARSVDIVVENFRPGTLERWNLGYGDLAKINPKLVLVRISGFGQNGPLSQRPGYGVIGEAISGLRHMIGDPDRPPSRVAIPLTDYIAGVYSAFGAVMALHNASRTGVGQCVDTALYEAAFSFIEPHIPGFEKTGAVPMRAGAKLPDSTPNNLYPTADGSYIHLAALADAVFERLVMAIGEPELANDPRFRTQRARAENEEALESIITAWTAAHDAAEIEAIMTKHAVPAAPVFTIADVFKSDHFRARNMLVNVPDDDLGTVTLAGIVPKLSRTPGELRWAGRRIGQDTREILRILGKLSDHEIQNLTSEGVVYCDPLSDSSMPNEKAS
ncbi:MAG: CaiB/BaiF CoA transferase family protein [Variibacter sp.]